MSALRAGFIVIVVGVVSAAIWSLCFVQSARTFAWQDLNFSFVFAQGESEDLDRGGEEPVEGAGNAVDQAIVGRVGQAVAKAQRRRYPNAMQHMGPVRLRRTTAYKCDQDLSLTVNGQHDGGSASSSPEWLAFNSSIVRRTWLPQAILLGVQKGGTTALDWYLRQHEQVAFVTKEIYFLDDGIDRFMINEVKDSPDHSPPPLPATIMRDLYAKAVIRGMVSAANRQREREANLTRRQATELIRKTAEAAALGGAPPYYYKGGNGSQYIRLQTVGPPRPTFRRVQRADVLSANEDKLIMDLTPHYIYFSDKVPQRITCIVPWVKLLVLLRDPIERARSQYDMKKRVPGLPQKVIKTFDEYVDQDIAALRETGVIQDWSKVSFEKFAGSDAERQAWRTYTNQGLNAPVGMSLYAIQLDHLLQQMDRSGKPRSDLLALRSEDLHLNTDATFRRVQEHLGLRRITLKEYPIRHSAGEKGPSPIEPSTREKLRSVFEPYNRRLAKLLGDDWKDVWTTTT